MLSHHGTLDSHLLNLDSPMTMLLDLDMPAMFTSVSWSTLERYKWEVNRAVGVRGERKGRECRDKGEGRCG